VVFRSEVKKGTWLGIWVGREMLVKLVIGE
jgi:hypothetical protein